MNLYTVDKRTGEIAFPDGFKLLLPYDSPRYLEYAEWVTAGNSPTEIESTSLLAEEEIEVRPDQARNALDMMGLYDEVLALMADPATPRFIKIKFEYTTSFRRNDDALIMMAQILKWNAQRLNELFALAKTL